MATIVVVDPIRSGFDMSEADYILYQGAAADRRITLIWDGGQTVGGEKGWTRHGRIDLLDN